MSVTVMGRVLYTPLATLKAKRLNGKEYAVSPHAAKIILIAMADSADDFGENSYNSLDTLATKSSLQRRSVPRVVRALEQNQYCTYKGLSVYGTSNYTLNLEKLGFPPKRRPKVGRPKTSDSERETSDSERETSDSESPDPSLTHPLTFNDDESLKNRTALLAKLYADNIGAITPLMADSIQDAAVDYPEITWYEPAFKIAVDNNARSWTYVDTVLGNWKKHGFGWKPTKSKKKFSKNGKTPAPKSQLTPEQIEESRREAERMLVP